LINGCDATNAKYHRGVKMKSATSKQSTVVKRPIVIKGHKTSVSIEDIFWLSLKEIAREEGMTLSTLVCSIDERRTDGSNLSSAIRVSILTRFRDLAQSLARRVTHVPGPVAVQPPRIAAMTTD
jgi:predicted DNA-binding ribbon-helix-helix protein